MKTIKIQSFSDIITNSSSEIFIFKSDINIDEIRTMLNTHYDKHFVLYPADDDFTCNTCGGMGGIHEITEIDKNDKNEYIEYELSENYVNTDKHIYKVHIDRNSYATIDWLLDMFKDSIEMIY